jgi:hypothetical protein
MAIVTHGQESSGFVLFFAEMDALDISFVNPVVAIGAGTGDIFSMNAGFGIVFRENMVRRVTIRTHGGYHQAAFKQSFTVNTHHVIFQNVMLFAGIPDSGFTSLLMTTPAQIRDVGGVGGRFGIVMFFYIMLSMAVEAGWSVGIPSFNQAAMGAGIVCRHHVGMANRTINLGPDGGTGSFHQGIHAGVTAYAGLAPVIGTGEFDTLNIKGDLLPVPNHLQIFPGMTFKTIPVGHTQFIKYFPYGMGSVTVDTDRYFIGLFLPEFSLDDFGVHGFNLAVAFLAGFGHVVFVYGGVLVGVGKHIVGGVAIGANRGYSQAFMEQPLAVNTQRIMGKNTVLGDIVTAIDFGPLFMAFAAHIRNIELGYPGIPALRRQFDSLSHLLTMQASGVSFGDIIVTYAAIH